MPSSDITAFRAEMAALEKAHHEAHLARPPGDGLVTEMERGTDGRLTDRPTGRRVPPPPDDDQEYLQPIMSVWLRSTAHSLGGMVASMCGHGVLLVIDPDDMAPDFFRIQTEGAKAALADGRLVVRPRMGQSFIRAKYMTGNMTCVVCQGADPPADLTTPATNRPSPTLCHQPVRIFTAEVYSPEQHGQLQVVGS